MARNRSRRVTTDMAQDGSEDSVYVVPYRGKMATLTVTAVDLSTLASLLAIIWQHVTAVSTMAIVRSMAGNRMSASVGLGAMILGWFVFGVLAMTVILLFFSIRLVKDAEFSIDEI